ncbi:helix-turn-helix domain-containing protein (plasmid) [Polymorphobacter sp. PAMC 29334]|nr:helix-turn-helix domain-containing protein [Polymorphobacter sp. PAMC 29334]
MSEPPSTVGRRIRAVRHSAGLSLDAFASAVGYSRRAVINWEQNNAAPPIGVLPTLRRLYDVDPEWVLSGENETPTSTYVAPDWHRLDRLAAEVASMCAEVGADIDHAKQQHLARMLYDQGNDAGQAASSQLRKVLSAISYRSRDHCSKNEPDADVTAC